jgi:triacylglycerol lipase
MQMAPVVMHHGMFGFGTLKAGPIEISYFHGIERSIAAHGHRVIVSSVHPTAGVEKRAGQLRDTILSQLPLLAPDGEKITLIAHSLGGLDARYMLSRMGMAEHIGALLTVSTPHRGSPYADYWFHHLEYRLGAMRLLKLLSLDMDSLSDLTTASCARFNELITDAPGVRYYSVGASRPRQQMPPFVMHAHRLIEKAEGDNDGMVSVKSSRWGEHLGTWPAHHFQTINKRLGFTGPDDIAPYYLEALRQMEQPSGEVPAMPAIVA